jgi:hypothetical protein
MGVRGSTYKFWGGHSSGRYTLLLPRCQGSSAQKIYYVLPFILVTIESYVPDCSAWLALQLFCQFGTSRSRLGD